MATCKDCIHEDLCGTFTRPCMPDEANASERLCKNFKNVDDFAEVVRCKDCKFCEHFYPEKLPGKLPREAYYCNPKRLGVSANSYCSDGQRKSK